MPTLWGNEEECKANVAMRIRWWTKHMYVAWLTNVNAFDKEGEVVLTGLCWNHQYPVCEWFPCAMA